MACKIQIYQREIGSSARKRAIQSQRVGLHELLLIGYVNNDKSSINYAFGRFCSLLQGKRDGQYKKDYNFWNLR
jgi:hypothetical protein